MSKCRRHGRYTSDRGRENLMNQQKAHAPETDRTRYAIVAILLLAAVARFAFIGRESLSYDELYNVWTNRLSFSGMLSEQLAGSHPPLYYVVVRAWYLLGTGEALSLIHISE